MKIHNVRAGFATNSSSSHSIVMIPRGYTVANDEHTHLQYNWEQFTLSDRDSKTAYFAAQLYNSLSYQGLDDTSSAHIINTLLMTAYSVDDLKNSSVDHQSCWMGLRDAARTGNNELIRAYYDWIVRPDVVILGGNDNDEPQQPPDESWEPDEATAFHNRFTNFRRDGDTCIVFNSNTGTKLRFSPNYDAPDYTKSSLPELVDLKITDNCTYGCEFCLIPGTLIAQPHGTKRIEQIRAGDDVLVFNIDDGVLENADVEEVYTREYHGIVYVVTLDDNSVITMTPEHPVYVHGHGWLEAQKLQANMNVTTLGNMWPEKTNASMIQSIVKEQYDGMVYNFATPPQHNYFANGLLVHNCYQGSTKAGKHAKLEDIKRILDTLAAQGCFEIAFGGGEPTRHPHFAEILEYTHSLNMAPNFTTFGVDWIKKQKLMNVVYQCVRAIGVSVHNKDDLKKVEKIQNAIHSMPNVDHGHTRVVAQHVVGTTDVIDLATLVEDCWENGYDLLLLGYKPIGFGANFTPHDTTGLDTILKLRQEKRPHWNSRCSMLGVDTAFVQQFDPLLKEVGVPSVLKTSEEGKFSMYIDAVSLQQGPSSYMPDQMVPLDMQNLDESIRNSFAKW